jgi:hypothetical protein
MPGTKRDPAITLSTNIKMTVKPPLLHLALLLLGALAGCDPSDSSKIAGALALGRLAPLPASAHDVAVKTSGNMFARVFWLRFSASSEAISAWLAASRGIANHESGKAAPPAEVSASCLYQAPAWYRPSEVQRGRLLEIPPDDDEDRGWVLVDDDRQDLLICTSHS